jgi:hypothetical protein
MRPPWPRLRTTALDTSTMLHSTVAVVEWVVFGRSRVQFSARRPAVINDIYRGSFQSLKANSGIVP